MPSPTLTAVKFVRTTPASTFTPIGEPGIEGKTPPK
jgi:hypothetical protein